MSKGQNVPRARRFDIGTGVSCRAFVIFSALFGISRGYTVYNPYFHFPGASEVYNQLIVTIAVPLEVPTPTPGEILFNSIFAAEYFEPTNETEFEYPPLVSDETSSSERTILYEFLQRRIEEFGFPGRHCLLRVICEISECSTQYTSVLGDIVHILLTPSTSSSERDLQDHEEAENTGRRKGCEKFRKKCPYGVLDAITTLGDRIRV